MDTSDWGGETHESAGRSTAAFSLAALFFFFFDKSLRLQLLVGGQPAAIELTYESSDKLWALPVKLSSERWGEKKHKKLFATLNFKCAKETDGCE